MQIKYSGEFLKHYKARIFPNQRLVKKSRERLTVFKTDPTSPLLRDHPLVGEKSDYRAFSMTGDIRVVYKIIGDEIWFYDVGSHNQVY